MSFRVNTNVAAMNALRNVSQTATDFNKSINRLSTGLRINTAA
ncbi:MAG: flagellin, partial [Fimbriimonadaceae bacterium]|nr:flagellin [Fimbriimonadaceae bacterium]